MIDLVSEKVWESLRTVTWPGPVRAAIAYVGREAPELLPLGAGDTLVFDGSDESLAGGTTNPAALQVLFDRGVILVSVARLHAKVIVAGSEEAGERKTLVGSANASERSRTSLREAALLTDDVEVAAQADLQIDRWSGARGSEWVNQEWIDRARGIYRPQAARKPRAVPRAPTSAGLWVVPWIEDETPPSPQVEAVLGLVAQEFVEHSIERYRLGEDGYKDGVRVGDEFLPFTLADDQEVPTGNRRSWPVTTVVRLVRDSTDGSTVAICVTPPSQASVTYAAVRRVAEGQGHDLRTEGPLPASTAASIRALWSSEEESSDAEGEASESGLRSRPLDCPRCGAELRLIFWGMPPGPVDPDVYVMGGCALPAGPVATHSCSACRWEGRRRDWNPDHVRGIASLDDLFAVLEAADLESLADRVTDDLDHDPVGLDVHEDSDGSAIGVEAILGGNGVLLEFPFSNVDFWDTWDGLHDSWELRTDEHERELDEA
ncbi:phospholipase D-like domain-containing protein [Oerskovia enterophila]|uniref:hypothetical protein n=1 Tax=Oerskovia enterophila TaxID=43678 RepID=UPI00380C9E41